MSDNYYMLTYNNYTLYVILYDNVNKMPNIQPFFLI